MTECLGLEGGSKSGRSSSADWLGGLAGSMRGDGDGEREESVVVVLVEEEEYWGDMNRVGNNKESTIPM